MAENLDAAEKPAEIKADLRKFNQAEGQVNKAIDALKKVEIKDKESADLAMTVLQGAKKVETLIEAKRKELVGPYNSAVKKINDFAKSLTAKLPPEMEVAKNKVIAWNNAEKSRIENERALVRITQLESMGFVKKERPIGGFLYEYPEIFGLNFPEASIIKYDDNTFMEEVNLSASIIAKHKENELAKLNEAKDDIEAFGSDEEKKELQEKIEAAGTIVSPAPVMPVGGRGMERAAASFSGGHTTKRWTFEVEDTAKIPAEYLQVNEVAVRAAIAAGNRSIPGIRIFQKEGLTIK